MSNNEKPAVPLVAIIGPTASGKSSLGVAVAKHFGGEVLCCDSTQLYRRFDIGTGKITTAEQQGIPHHLMDLLEPGEVFTAGAYRTKALEVLQDLASRKKLPVLTVGTGLYLRALLEGLADAPTRSDEVRARLRARAEEHGPGYLHEVLARLDPEAAGRIAARDTPKLIRAIEVCVLAGKPISDLHRAGRPRLEGYRPIKIGLSPPRPALYDRIESRIDAMLKSGWMEEVKRLVESGISVQSKPFQFIGYSQLRTHVAGVITLEEAVKAIRQATRRYAKRQLTWFRKESNVHWLEGFGDEEKVRDAVLTYVQQEIKK
jgi:tRNA dimethylallyltransferase